MKLLGLDPGLQNTGWGIIRFDGNHLSFIAAGTIHTDVKCSLSERLMQLHSGIDGVIEEHSPDETAVE